MTWLLSLIPDLFSSFGGWEWLLGAAGGPITLAAVFLKKWKWVALAVGIAAIALWIMALYLGISHRDTQIATLTAAAKINADNYAACQRDNAITVAEMAKVQRRHAQDLAAVTKAYDRRMAALAATLVDKESIHEAAKECVGSAAAYRAALDRLRVGRSAGSIDDADTGGAGHPTGRPADLQGRAPNAGGQPRRRGQRRLVLRRDRSGRRLPEDSRAATTALQTALIGGQS